MSTEEKDPQNEQPEKEDQEKAPFESRMDLSGVEKLVSSIRAEIGKIIVGQQRMVDLLIAALLADGHVLIEGVPGVAKTLTTKLLAQTIASDFSRIQFTPDLMPADVIGTSVFNPKTTDFEFKEGPVFSNIVLIDEINRSPAKTQAALFEVMEERQITVDGKTYLMEAPFMVVATQNPIEHEGTYRLPEAQLDRFLFRIDVPYPSLDEEVKILSGSYSRKNKLDISKLDKVISGEEITKQRDVVSSIHVEPELMEYIAQIIQNTRNSNSVSIGASPRASVFVMRAAQAWAAMNGRDFITPEDVKEMINPVLRHRITLTPEKEMEGMKPDQVIQIILEKVEVPR
ncbi:MAG: magnesium chelatase [Balneola sp.]|jgi:MoxR-like ATPase|nr:magnesium chelatase [Balneola sp.]MBE78864.1 magnesium chelatase [Balneola sp.]HBX67418.1 magnesium chelatase [Balneolaceae bacterium]|tara:strand:- start:217 stop:1245 length:1029 start_codon:yes stop_codon:yes gene_type:complete